MADDRLTATLIADGHHLPADTLKVIVRAKGIHRSILVSDSVALAGMPPGLYFDVCRWACRIAQGRKTQSRRNQF